MIHSFSHFWSKIFDSHDHDSSVPTYENFSFITIIFFIILKTIKSTSKIQIPEVCDIVSKPRAAGTKNDINYTYRL